MFCRLVRRSLFKGWRKKALAVIMVTLGTSLAVAMLNISLDIGDKVSRELRSYGANILVTPVSETIPLEVEGLEFNPLANQSYLSEEELPRMKMIFWRNNILGFAPYLETRAELPGGVKVPVIGTWFEKTLIIPTGETIIAGVKDIKPWWRVEGNWPDDLKDRDSALMGQALAEKLSLKPGDSLDLAFASNGSHSHSLKVLGIISAGGEEDKQVFVPLSWAQELTRLKGRVSRVEVSALTQPKNELARKWEENPDSLTPEEFDTWYCSAYVDSIAYQIEEAIPTARARPIRQIAESEGAILGKVRLLMSLLALAGLFSSVLGISSLMSASAMERSQEIGLLKALGAYNSSIILLFLAEALIIGITGGIAGYTSGLGLARFVMASVFGMGLEVKALALPSAFAISIGVSMLGAISAARIISMLEPSKILVGR